MAVDTLKTFRDVDPEFNKVFNEARTLVFSEGALSVKTKNLIAMAIDATHGAVGGVTSLAQRAMKLGATKEEIVETLRVAYHIGGAGTVYTSARALSTIFAEK